MRSNISPMRMISSAAYIWEINSHHEGTPEQLTNIIATIKDENARGLFLETSVDPPKHGDGITRNKCTD